MAGADLGEPQPQTAPAASRRLADVAFSRIRRISLHAGGRGIHGAQGGASTDAVCAAFPRGAKQSTQVGLHSTGTLRDAYGRNRDRHLRAGTGNRRLGERVAFHPAVAVYGARLRHVH